MHHWGGKCEMLAVMGYGAKAVLGLCSFFPKE